MLRGLDAFDDRALVCIMGDNVSRLGYTDIRNFKVAARRELGDQCISVKRSDLTIDTRLWFNFGTFAVFIVYQ